MANNENGEKYIDLDDALKRVGGNMALYKKLLTRFVDSTYLQDVVDSVQGGNMEEASRHAHTLKGVAANLSLVQVRALCIELEGKIHDGQDCVGCVENLKQAVGVTIEKIAEL